MTEMATGKWRGLLIAGLIYGGWIGHLIFWLSADLAEIHWPRIVMALLLQTWLYVGLFITAHDAMHGAVVPGQERLNHWIGQLAVFSYALFSYNKLLQRHGLHHSFPASAKDPDFHDGIHTHPLRWYLHFMLHYLTAVQIVGMAILFNILQHGAHVPLLNLLLFWVAPALLSTFQLFYFGTYLPHRKPPAGYDNIHRAASSNYPAWLSQVTCFHFGYHLEHHLQPVIPWWRLPRYRRLRNS